LLLTEEGKLNTLHLGILLSSSLKYSQNEREQTDPCVGKEENDLN